MPAVLAKDPAPVLGFCCQRLKAAPMTPGTGVPMGNASQIALCLTHAFKLAMWKPTSSMGWLRSPHTHTLPSQSRAPTEPVNQKKGFSCISSNSHKVIQHGDRQQGMAFAAEVLHLTSDKGQTRLQREKDKWDSIPRRPAAGAQRRLAETAGCSAHSAAR